MRTQETALDVGLVVQQGEKRVSFLGVEAGVKEVN